MTFISRGLLFNFIKNRRLLFVGRNHVLVRRHRLINTINLCLRVSEAQPERNLCPRISEAQLEISVKDFPFRWTLKVLILHVYIQQDRQEDAGMHIGIQSPDPP